MNQFKKAQVVMLPTENKSTILLQLDCKPSINLQLANKATIGTINWQKQHLYIISDDEIKEGDWIYQTVTKLIIKAPFDCKNDNRFKKIIATTDTSLKIFAGKGDICDLYYNLPQPSQQFIKKYIESYNKGEVITNVLVGYEWFLNKQSCFKTVCYQQDIEARDSCMAMCEQQKIKINSDNTITIKQQKDNWNREELINIFKECIRYCDSDSGFRYDDFEYWIEENL